MDNEGLDWTGLGFPFFAALGLVNKRFCSRWWLLVFAGRELAGRRYTSGSWEGRGPCNAFQRRRAASWRHYTARVARVPSRCAAPLLCGRVSPGSEDGLSWCDGATDAADSLSIRLDPKRASSCRSFHSPAPLSIVKQREPAPQMTTLGASSPPTPGRLPWGGVKVSGCPLGGGGRLKISAASHV